MELSKESISDLELLLLSSNRSSSIHTNDSVLQTNGSGGVSFDCELGVELEIWKVHYH